LSKGNKESFEMKLKMMLCLLAIVIGGFAVVQSQDTQEEPNVRGAFLTSRPKEKPPESSSTSRPKRRRPKSQTTTVKGSVTVTTGTSSTSAGATAKLQPMGLGVTLFTRDANGLAVRVDPAHEFHKGDRVRVLLETNSDGYLYIFNTTDGGPPVMIYPSAEIDEGGNYLQAHVPFDIPSSTATEERLRWFQFDQYAGTERLFFVLTREPIPGVPIDDDLMAYCRDNAGKCPWRPDTEVWAQVQKELATPLKVDKTQKYGKAQTSSEQAATTRGLGLSQEDPEPSVIMMAVSVNRNNLVTSLDLIHK
jgi:hypothetical protein